MQMRQILLNQFQQAHHFVINRLSKAFSIIGMKREERLEIPEVAFREALVNLLVHRNYHIQAPSKISISRATAQRWLNVLIEKGLIERVGRTRNLRYRRITKE